MKTQRVLAWLLFLPLFLVPSGSAAQTPACGSTISVPGTVVTFDENMTCSAGFTGTALRIAADNVAIDGAGFAIIAPEASRILYIANVSHAIIRDLNLSRITGSQSQSFGILISGPSGGNIIENNEVAGHTRGIYIVGNIDNSIFRNNKLPGNDFGIVSGGNSRAGNTFTGNDVSRSTIEAIALVRENNVNVSDNDCTNSNAGVRVSGTRALIARNLISPDPSASQPPGYGIVLSAASGPSEGNTVEDNRVTGMARGIYIIDSVNNSIFHNNRLSGNFFGIVSGGNSRTGNTYSNNDVSWSTT